MFDRRHVLILLAGSAVAPPALAASSPADPITAIYRKASAGKGESGGNFVWYEQKDRARWFTKSLAKLWDDEEKKTPKGDETPPGFDPISNSQDPLVRNPKVEVEKSDGKTATVTASFTRWGQESGTTTRIIVRYDMVLENGPKGLTWKIDDIRGTTDGKEWSIRAIVKGWNG